MGLIEEIIANAQANKQRIVLPEGDEPRTLKAADRIVADGIADVILIGPAQKIADMVKEFGLKNIGPQWQDMSRTAKLLPTAPCNGLPHRR